MMLYIFIFLLTLWTYRLLTNRKPPGPWGLPILGYLPFINPKAPYLTFTTLSKRYGEIYGLYLGNIYTVVLSNAGLISSTFAKDKVTGRAPLYLTHGIMKGYGLICAEGEMWRIHRKFTAKYLRLFGGTRISKAKTLEEMIMGHVSACIKSIEDGAAQGPLDPLKELQHSLGSVMCQLVFGKTWSKTDQTWQWLQHLQEDGTKAIGIAGPLNFLPFLRYVPKYKNVMAFLLDGKHKTHEIYRQLIDQQREEVNKDDFVPENMIQAFLVEAASACNDELFGDQQFCHLLADIFGAGLDTTLTTLRWYLLYLSANPHVQDNVQKELDEVVQNRQVTLEDMGYLPYTRASIAETQRIRSVVPVGIPHATLDDIQLCGYDIPKGTMIVPLQWAVHMDGQVWRESDSFDPDRFLKDGVFTKPKEFIPFQTGKRMCIGEDLANFLLLLFGASIVRRFNIRLPQGCTADLTGEIGITLTPKEQHLHFILRN